MIAVSVDLALAVIAVETHLRNKLSDPCRISLQAIVQRNNSLKGQSRLRFLQGCFCHGCS